MEQHQEPDRAQTYQRKMQALYAEDAAAKFKQDFWPADPFETGVLVEAKNLAISELVAIYKAAKVLEDQGNEAFVNSLILYRGCLNLMPLIRVNPVWFDACRQRKIQICNLLHSFYWESSRVFEARLYEILDAGDLQLLEYVRQAEEALIGFSSSDAIAKHEATDRD